MRVTYRVEQITSLPPEKLARIVRQTADAFQPDRLFQFLFHRERDLLHFLTVGISYYLRMGQVYLCYDEAGKVCGMSLWNEPGGKYITATNTLKCGMLAQYVQFLLRTSPKSFYRILKFSGATQAHHYKEPHAYLFLLVSFQRGAGSALMNDAIHRFGTCDFYLENSNLEGNDAFYHKFDLCDLPKISWKGAEVRPMLRKGVPQDQAPPAAL